MRSRNKPNIDFDFTSTTHASYHTFLQSPQEFCLHIDIHIPYLVKKQRSTRSSLKEAYLSLHSTGERTFFVTEESTFHKIIWNSRHINGNKRTVCTSRERMYSASGNLLTRTRLPINTDIDFRISRLSYHLFWASHHRIVRQKHSILPLRQRFQA